MCGKSTFSVYKHIAHNIIYSHFLCVYVTSDDKSLQNYVSYRTAGGVNHQRVYFSPPTQVTCRRPIIILPPPRKDSRHGFSSPKLITSGFLTQWNKCINVLALVFTQKKMHVLASAWVRVFVISHNLFVASYFDFFSFKSNPNYLLIRSNCMVSFSVITLKVVFGRPVLRG